MFPFLYFYFSIVFVCLFLSKYNQIEFAKKGEVYERKFFQTIKNTEYLFFALYSCSRAIPNRRGVPRHIRVVIIIVAY